LAFGFFILVALALVFRLARRRGLRPSHA